jgi:hypothetical protein
VSTGPRLLTGNAGRAFRNGEAPEVAAARQWRKLRTRFSASRRRSKSSGGSSAKPKLSEEVVKARWRVLGSGGGVPFPVAAAGFLILELDGPLDGVIKISSEPLQYALANLSQ